MADIVKIFQEEVANVKNASGVLPSCIFQPIPTTVISQFGKNGGNALGISPSDGPLNSTYRPLLDVL
jgi:hypothetical protein